MMRSPPVQRTSLNNIILEGGGGGGGGGGGAGVREADNIYRGMYCLMSHDFAISDLERGVKLRSPEASN